MSEISNRTSVGDTTYQEYLNNLNLTTPMLAQNETILDLGAGSGKFAYYAKSLGIDVHSLDIRHPQKYPLLPPIETPYVRASGLALPFLNSSFDMVVSHYAFMNIARVREDLVTAITEIKRILKPKGEFHFGPGGIALWPIRWSEALRMQELQQTRKNRPLDELEQIEFEHIRKEVRRRTKDLKPRLDLYSGIADWSLRNFKYDTHTLEDLQAIDPNFMEFNIQRTDSPFYNKCYVLVKGC